MITREGMETALLIATALFQMKSSAVFARPRARARLARRRSAFLWTRLGKGVDLKTLLNVSAVFLAIFLVQLVLYGIHELSEARLFPASQAIHDATEILGPGRKDRPPARLRARGHSDASGSAGCGGSAGAPRGTRSGRPAHERGLIAQRGDAVGLGWYRTPGVTAAPDWSIASMTLRRDSRRSQLLDLGGRQRVAACSSPAPSREAFRPRRPPASSARSRRTASRRRPGFRPRADPARCSRAAEA